MKTIVKPRSPGAATRRLWLGAGVALLLSLGMSACDTARSVRPLNRVPVVLTLSAFPQTIAPGDSALVTCTATDADGDTLLYFWTSDCRLLTKSGRFQGDYVTYENNLVVYPGPCNAAPVDTGWVRCSVSDHRGGYVYAGYVLIVVQQ